MKKYTEKKAAKAINQITANAYWQKFSAARKAALCSPIMNRDGSAFVTDGFRSLFLWECPKEGIDRYDVLANSEAIEEQRDFLRGYLEQLHEQTQKTVTQPMDPPDFSREESILGTGRQRKFLTPYGQQYNLSYVKAIAEVFPVAKWYCGPSSISPLFVVAQEGQAVLLPIRP